MYSMKGIIVLVRLAIKREMKSGECGVDCNCFLSLEHSKFLIFTLGNVPLLSMLDPYFSSSIFMCSFFSQAIARSVTCVAKASSSHGIQGTDTPFFFLGSNLNQKIGIYMMDQSHS